MQPRNPLDDPGARMMLQNRAIQQNPNIMQMSPEQKQAILQQLAQQLMQANAQKQAQQMVP